jgi:GNAT superfamily N-acetyltransferase
MLELKITLPGEDLEIFCSLNGTSPLNPDACVEQNADLHLISFEKGKIAARCSLWWNSPPLHEGKPTGLVGHYAAANPEAGLFLLEHACRELRNRGCQIIIGPMDGSTWHSYRLITEKGTEPQFFLEIDHPADWPEHFFKAGFSSAATYYSTLNRNLSGENQISDPPQGIRIRPLFFEKFQEELKKIYTLSIESFKENFLYSPISQENFFSLYLPVKNMLNPDLILFAEEENGGKLAGFIFAIPDFFEKKRGGKIKTVILKSTAVHPNWRGKGLGNFLLAACQDVGFKLGYTRAIHAYMHEKNRSLKISARLFGSNLEPLRRYTLFAKDISHL